jgi:hypothetical protein
MHKNSGRKPHHAIDESLREKIIFLKESHSYANANFQHFQELLVEYEKNTISYVALYALLKKDSCFMATPIIVLLPPFGIYHNLREVFINRE